MLAQLDPVTASMFDNQGVVMWPPPVTKEIPEERQPGGWASPGRLLELANKGGEGGAYGGDVDRAGSRRGDVA